MEGLTNFVSKSFEEKSKETQENVDKKFKICDILTENESSNPGHTSTAHDNDEPKDLSMIKIDVCSSRPETPIEDTSGFESGKIADGNVVALSVDLEFLYPFDDYCIGRNFDKS